MFFIKLQADTKKGCRLLYTFSEEALVKPEWRNAKASPRPIYTHIYRPGLPSKYITILRKFTRFTQICALTVFRVKNVLNNRSLQRPEANCYKSIHFLQKRHLF